MKNFIIIISLIFYSCNESNQIKNIKSNKELIKDTVEKTQNIEIITDKEKLENLRAEIKLELERKKRIRLNSLPLALRLIEYDSLAYDSINLLLKSNNYNEIKKFLNDFILYKPIKFKLKNNSIKNNLFELLEDSVIEYKAMKTIAVLNLNYEAVFIDRFKNGQEDLKFKYFYWLGSKGTNVEVLEIILDLIKRNKISKNNQEVILLGLSQFSNSKNENVREIAINAALLAYKNKWITSEDIISLNNENHKSEKAEIFLKMILKNGGVKAKSIHNICLKQGILIKEIFKNLVQSKNAKTLSILLNQLTNKKDFLKTLSAIPIVYKAYNDSNILIKTIQMTEKHKNLSEELEDKLYYVFNKINCLDYLKNADKYVKDKEISNQLKSLANRPLPPVQTYEDIVNDLFALSITDSIGYSTIVEIKNNEIYQGNNSLIKNILHYNKQFTSIDKWSASIPIKYDLIIKSIQNQLKGEINNIFYKTIFHNNQYSIIMIASKKGVIIYPEVNTDIIDCNIIIEGFNKILSDKKLYIINEDPDYFEIFYGLTEEVKSIKLFFTKKQVEI